VCRGFSRGAGRKTLGSKGSRPTGKTCPNGYDWYMPRQAHAALATFTCALLVLAFSLLSSASTTHAYGPVERAAHGQTGIRYAALLRGRRLPSLSGGTTFSARSAFVTSSRPTIAPTASTLGCAGRTSNGNIRVNQDCTWQRQTAGAIAVNPTNSKNLVAAQNDASIGWNHCGFDYSLDGGSHWGSGTPPFFERGNHPATGHTLDHDAGTLHTYDAASDPSVAFDAKGNAFLSCVLFDINDPANGIYVARSPAGADGSFYNPIPPYRGTGKDAAIGVVIEDNTENATGDEPKIAADSFATSPFRDNVYITWTEFIAGPLCTQGGTCSSPIYFSRSTNSGAKWSTPIEISGNSRALCGSGNLFDSRRKPHDCDLDQGSDPVVLPNGDVVVVFNNANTEGTTVNNQILAVVSKDGGRTWSRPTLVGADVVADSPQCNLGDGNGVEECIPGAFVRANDDPMTAVDPTNGTVYTVWNDYSAGRYAVRISRSSNSGKLWTEALKPVTTTSSVDTYMPSAAIDPISHEIVVAYYRSGRVPNESTHSGLFVFGTGGVGSQTTQFAMATSSSSNGPWKRWAVSPAFASPNGAQQGYNGDYSGLAISGDIAHPLWSDTRNTVGVVRDEDVFTSSVSLP
jgi:hypothetical protein